MSECLGALMIGLVKAVVTVGTGLVLLAIVAAVVLGVAALVKSFRGRTGDAAA